MQPQLLDRHRGELRERRQNPLVAGVEVVLEAVRQLDQAEVATLVADERDAQEPAQCRAPISRAVCQSVRRSSSACVRRSGRFDRQTSAAAPDRAASPGLTVPPGPPEPCVTVIGSATSPSTGGWSSRAWRGRSPRRARTFDQHLATVRAETSRGPPEQRSTRPTTRRPWRDAGRVRCSQKYSRHCVTAS